MNVYAIMSLIALGLNVALGAYVLSRGIRTALNWIFFGVMMSLAIWSAGEFMMRISSTPSEALWASRVAGIGWCLVGGLFVIFALALIGKDDLTRDWRVLAACFVPAAFFLVLLWTTHTIFEGFFKSYWGFQEIGGALRMPSKLYVVITFVAGAVILYRFWRSAAPGTRKSGAGFVLLAMTLPLAAGLVTDVILPALDIRIVEMPMFATTVIAPIIAYAVLTQGVMNTIAGRMGSTIIRNIDDAVMVVNACGVMETVNPAMTTLSGYTEEELTGSAPDSFLATSLRSDTFPVVETGETSFWNLFKSKSGELIPVTVSSSDVLKKSGKVRGTVTVLHDMRGTLRLLRAEREVKDVTAQVAAERDRSEVLMRSEEEIRKYSAFLGGVIENITEPLFIMNADHQFVYVNQAFCEISGVCNEDIIGRTNDEMYWRELSGFLREVEDQVLQTGLLFEVPEVTVNNIHGEEKIGRATLAPMKNEDGEVEFMIGVLEDVTEQKKLDTERLEFIRIAAHELRTPLTSLKLGFEMLARETRGTLSYEQERSLNVLSLSIERLSKLSKNLLDLAGMDSGLVTLERREFDVGGLLVEAAAVFEGSSKEKGLEIRTELAEGARKAYADPQRISQVLYNLLSNAVKYTDEGGIVLSLVDRPEGFLEIHVSDTGSGIPASQKAAIFSRFVKATTNEGAEEGTGLGLAISKAIVEAHSGTIRVESKVGEGSTFIFKVPVAPTRLRDVPGKADGGREVAVFERPEIAGGK